MNEKKNIERLFQEKFKDFEVVPEEHIWENIEAKLKDKEKRRVIPFWWKLSGVAAILIIGFLIANALFFSKPNQVNDVVIQDNNNPTENKTTVKPLENQLKSNETIVNTEIEISNDKSKQNSLSNGSLKSSGKNNTNNTNGNVVSLEEKNLKNNTPNGVKNNKSKLNSKTNPHTIVGNSEIVTANSNKQESNSPNNYLTENTVEKNKILTTDSNKKQNVQQSTNLVEKNEIVATDLNGKKSIPQNNNLAESTVEKPLTNPENRILKEENSPKTTFENTLPNTVKPSEVVVAENKILENKNIDTTKIAVVANALEELLKEKETKKKAEPKLNRWQVATTVAPIYFSSTSGGSPLDSKFESNDKKFEPSYSYGLGVNYAINKKWNIKTGVNTLAFEYNTNDVVIYQNMNASKIRNVNNNLQGSVLQVENKSSSNSPEVGLNGSVIKKFDGSLNQKMGYIEIPVEIGYKLIDKKFGVEIVTGISSLFLNENSVAVVSSGQSITIGEANNLNDFHFSGNLGFGFRYRFWKSFNANINPMFKYQMNTFNTDSGNFKPYVFGLYSGISYTF